MAATPQQSIEAYLTSNDETDQGQAIKSAAEDIEQVLQDSTDESVMEDKLWTLWQAVITTAKATSQHDVQRKQKLARYVLGLQAREAPSTQSGNPALVQDMKLWHDLPTFGWVLRDSWNVTITDSSTEKERSEWINLNAWTATLVQQAHEMHKDEPDVSLFGLWTIRNALETSDAVLDGALAAAAVWLRDATSTISDLSRSEKTFEGKMARPGSRFDNEEWRGFTAKRWQSWTERLEELQDQPSDNHISTIVRQARDAIASASAKQ